MKCKSLFQPTRPSVHMFIHSYVCHQKQITQGYLPPESFRSTSLAPLGSNWVSKEAENFKELKFFGLVRCFSVKIAQILKTGQKWRFSHVFGSILDFFEDFSVLTEKQHTKPKNLSSLKFSASFDTKFALRWRETSGDIPI